MPAPVPPGNCLRGAGAGCCLIPVWHRESRSPLGLPSVNISGTAFWPMEPSAQVRILLGALSCHCPASMWRKFVDNTDRGSKPDHADGDPRPAAVTFVTTEHFTLQGARSSTISESTGRANVFLGAVSGGLVALGLVATAAKTGVAFYMFGLILLPTLAFVGLATFHRVLQSGMEDLAYARRIALLRDYYFEHAPELTGYLLNPAERLPTPGLGIGLWQQFVTLAGMVAVITAVLAGSAGGLLAAIASGHSLVAALVVGVVVAAAALTGLTRYQNSAWIRGSTASLSPGEQAGPTERAPSNT
jgi:hypothetical protein